MGVSPKRPLTFQTTKCKPQSTTCVSKSCPLRCKRNFFRLSTLTATNPYPTHGRRVGPNRGRIVDGSHRRATRGSLHFVIFSQRVSAGATAPMRAHLQFFGFWPQSQSGFLAVALGLAPRPRALPSSFVVNAPPPRRGPFTPVSLQTSIWGYSMVVNIGGASWLGRPLFTNHATCKKTTSPHKIRR